MLNYMVTFRAAVLPEDCDALGHMNVQHYFRTVSDGMFELMQRLGLGSEEIARRRLSFAVVRAETDFKRELRSGEAMALESTMTQMSEKLAVFHHRLRRVPTDEIAMTTEYRCVVLDLDRRRAVAVPDDVRSASIALFPGLATT